MPESVSIKVFGDDHFRHKIQKMSLRALDAEPVMHSIGHDFLDIVEEQFATEGARGGRPWAQLKFDTITRRGSAHPILVDSGDMLIEMTGPDNLDISSDSVELKLPANILQKAEAAQYGFAAPNGKPVRPRRMVDFTTFDRHHFRNKISRWLTDGVV
jgi:hypothetical protein